MDAEQRGWQIDLVRSLLVGLGVLELVTGAALLVTGGSGVVPVHLNREMGTFAVALGVGLLAAAARPARTGGLLAVMVTVASISVLVGAIDVAVGRIALVDEIPHLLEVAAVLALWRLTRPGMSPRHRRMAPSL
jgi:hypothetical protein